MCKEETVKSEERMRRTRGEERIRVRKKSRRGVQMQERSQDTRKKEQQMSSKKSITLREKS